MRAAEWGGDGLVALVLSGSHATGEAVWAEVEGKRTSLSDLDLYAVLRDEQACRAAVLRARAGRASLRLEAAAAGLAGPVEVAFVTLEGLARMPARPGTVELARSARVLVGDAGVLARLPQWEAATVSAEERLLLLENRAFELLWAHGPHVGALASLRARHAVLKTALDLAAVRTLAHGELPAGAASRVARVRELGAPHPTPSWLAGAWEGLGPLWETALAWRGGRATLSSAAEARAEWRATARAWSTAWWAETTATTSASDPWRRVLAIAARAPLARRLRRSFAFMPHSGPPPAWSERVRGSLIGTPQHRIHGSASVLVLAAAQAAGDPRLPAGALRALRSLGVTRATDFNGAVRAALQAWDRQLHDGSRTLDEA
jgi:predicted nucleotidyltransferase